jgi:hypothetical protein
MRSPRLALPVFSVPFLSLTLAFASATVAKAQSVTTDFKLLSAAGALATAGSNSDFDSSPANTAIGPSTWTWRLQASANGTSGGSSVATSMSMWATRNNDNNGVQLGMTGLTRGGSTEQGRFLPSINQNAQPGPIDFLMTMTGTPSAQGAIQVTWQSLLKGTATVAASIDIGNDNSAEWQGGDVQASIKSAQLPVAFDAQGKIVVKLSLDGTITGAGPFVYSNVYGRLTARFMDASAGKCTITPYGSGCGGAAVAASVLPIGNDHVISLKLTGGFANAFVVEAVGTQAISLPLPAGCSLLCNAQTVLVHPTNAQGEYATTHKVSKFVAITAYHQFLPVDMQGNQLVLRASNGLKIVSTGR